MYSSSLHICSSGFNLAYKGLLLEDGVGGRVEGLKAVAQNG
jgi:hypothetical protein